VVDDAIMTGAVTAARLGQQIGRVAHALHAAGDDDPGGAGIDDVMRQHRGLHAGAADLVDGGGAGRIRQFGAARGLPRRSLTLSAGRTQPMNTSSIRSGDNFARSTAAPITWEPS